MINRMLGSRGLLSAALIVLLVLAGVVGFKLLKPTPDMRSYCALMPDSIGLYVGSDVTVMGMRVGSVTAVSPAGKSARVEFEIPADRTLPPDVGATTLSDTLIADRKLALIGAEPAGANWDSTQCITKTLTPKSISQTLNALAGLADELRDPTNPNVLRDLLSAVNTSTAGTGKPLNQVIEGLGTALNSPDMAIGRLGSIISAMSSLANRGAVNWDEIRDTLIRMGPTFSSINAGVLPGIIEALDGVQETIPALNDIVVLFGSRGLRALDAIPNLPQMISSGVASLSEVIDKVPVIVNAFSRSVDPASGRIALTYTPPRVAVPAVDATAICSVANRLVPGDCVDSSNGLLDVNLLHIVLATVGAQ